MTYYLHTYTVTDPYYPEMQAHAAQITTDYYLPPISDDLIFSGYARTSFTSFEAAENHLLNCHPHASKFVNAESVSYCY